MSEDKTPFFYYSEYQEYMYKVHLSEIKKIFKYKDKFKF